MQISIKKLPKGVVELSFEITAEDIRPQLEKAATSLSTERPIKGYRPGKASYDTVKAAYGEMAIYETALPDIVRKTFVGAVKENKLLTFGEPKISITKLVPGNPLTYTATVAIVPNVTELADARAIKVDSKKPEIKDDAVESALKDLQKMQTRETETEEAVATKHKVVIDMNLSRENVPLEGGQAKDHGIYMEEEYYIPGLKEQIIGMKSGEQKKFSLKFPETHYQKQLAGKDVDFEVTMKKIYDLILPELDNEFAKSLGQTSLDELRNILRKNMIQEAEDKESQRAELAVLEQLVEKSTFGEIPELILNTEAERMLTELKENVARQGADFEKYLESIKKTIDQLKAEFRPQAERRVKTALIMRDIADKEKIDVDDADVLAETQAQLNRYSDNAEAQEYIRSEEYQDTVRVRLRNQKVIAFLRETCVMTK